LHAISVALPHFGEGVPYWFFRYLSLSCFLEEQRFYLFFLALAITVECSSSKGLRATKLSASTEV
jgi:hypothetical protein